MRFSAYRTTRVQETETLLRFRSGSALPAPEARAKTELQVLLPDRI